MSKVGNVPLGIDNNHDKIQQSGGKIHFHGVDPKEHCDHKVITIGFS